VAPADVAAQVYAAATAAHEEPQALVEFFDAPAEAHDLQLPAGTQTQGLLAGVPLFLKDPGSSMRRCAAGKWLGPSPRRAHPTHRPSGCAKAHRCLAARRPVVVGCPRYALCHYRKPFFFVHGAVACS